MKIQACGCSCSSSSSSGVRSSGRSSRLDFPKDHSRFLTKAKNLIPWFYGRFLICKRLLLGLWVKTEGNLGSFLELIMISLG